MAEEQEYKFLRVLQANSIHKSINLIYVLKDISIPEQQNWDENVDEFLNWCSAIYKENSDAFSIDLYQKSAFPLETSSDTESLLIHRQTLQINDVYHRYLFDSEKELSKIQLNRIRPCSPIHINKYIQGVYKRVQETPESYLEHVVPYIESLPPSRSAWIGKVLRKESEQETVYFHDPHPTNGFILLPDSKWDRIQKSQLYLLAISQSQNIKSLRDLRASHLDFLMSLRARILQVLDEQYSMSWRDVRMIIHYQPSYYHFHVHVINIAVEGLGGTVVGQCHLLEDVIENLQHDGDYYAKRTLIYSLSCFHPLFKVLASQ